MNVLLEMEMMFALSDTFFYIYVNLHLCSCMPVIKLLGNKRMGREKLDTSVFPVLMPSFQLLNLVAWVKDLYNFYIYILYESLQVCTHTHTHTHKFAYTHIYFFLPLSFDCFVKPGSG